MITELSLYSIAEELTEQLEIGQTVEQAENELLKQKEYEIKHGNNAEFALYDYGIFEILSELKRSKLPFDYTNANSVYKTFYYYQLQQLNKKLEKYTDYSKETKVTKDNFEDLVDKIMKTGDM